MFSGSDLLGELEGLGTEECVWVDEWAGAGIGRAQVDDGVGVLKELGTDEVVGVAEVSSVSEVVAVKGVEVEWDDDGVVPDVGTEGVRVVRSLEELGTGFILSKKFASFVFLANLSSMHSLFTRALRFFVWLSFFVDWLIFRFL